MGGTGGLGRQTLLRGHPIDYWLQPGRTLSQRAAAAASFGGGHVHEWLCEMVAGPAFDDMPLTLRASTTALPFIVANDGSTASIP